MCWYPQKLLIGMNNHLDNFNWTELSLENNGRTDSYNDKFVYPLGVEAHSNSNEPTTQVILTPFFMLKINPLRG